MKIPFYIRLRQKLTPTRIIFLGFLLLVLIGTLLLMLPISQTGTQKISFLDALFTATSASCVTGLVSVDTGTTWNLFGKFVILLLIQIGGLGIMSIFTLFVLITKKHMNLKERLTIQESINSTTLSGSFRLFLKILMVTLSFELIGATVLFTQFKSLFGTKDGIIYSIFHSISAFCNAGFDIFGTSTFKSQSLLFLQSNPLVLLTLGSLIAIGGLGFVVWKDIWNNKFKIHRYTLHSKIVLISTLVLIISGTLLFYSFESNNQNTLLPMSTENKIINSVFQSITTRTAGFFSIDPSTMTEESNFLTIILMLIGAAPGSTGGGIKVTTFSILVLSSVFFIIGKENVQLMKNSIPRQIIFKSICIFMLAILLVVVGTFILLSNNPNLPLMDALYEVSSALSTCGLSTGITSNLNILSKITLILFMFIGRLGPLTLVIAFSHKQTLREVSYRYSDGKISVG